MIAAPDQEGVGRWVVLTVVGATICWTLATGVAGCDASQDDEGAEPPEQVALLPAVEGRPIVEVDGVAITDAQLAAAMRRAPAGADELEVLASLVELQVVAARAQAAGLDAQPSVALVQQRAMVQRLLEDEVEDDPEITVGEDEVRRAYDDFAMEFFTPELVTASHVLVHVPEEVQRADPARLEAARELATQIRAGLVEGAPDAAPDDEALHRLAWAGNLRGHLVTVESGLRFPRRQLAPLLGQPPRYPAMVEPFAEAAFGLDEASPVSQPVVTPFGVHVIVLRERTPASRPPFDEVADTIREDLLRRARAQHARSMIERLRGQARIEVDDGPIREP